MDPSRRPILFVSSPESGLLNPLLVLAGELARRGVPDLHFATDEPGRAQVEAVSPGAIDFVSLGEVQPKMSAVSWADDTYRAVTQPSRFKAHKAVLEHTVDPTLRVAKYRQLEAAVEKVRPALMVIESMSQFAFELAITHEIPYVLSVPFLPSNVLTAHTPFTKSYTGPDFPVPHSGLPYRMTVAQRLENRLFKLRTLAMFLTPAMSSRLTQDAKICDELGITKKARGQMARIDAAEMILCYSVPGLDYPFPAPATMRLVGTMVPPLPEAADDADLSGWLDVQRSVVFMGFGTITRLTRAQVLAFVAVARRLSEHSFLWKLPRDQQEFLPPAGELPGNLRIETWVPSQLDVLAHPNVTVFFTHAGGNGFHEGLYFGKPLVVRPLWVDCYDQAIRGQDCGVSLTLDKPGTVDVDDVVDKLTRVLGEPSFRERAQQFGAELRAAGGRQSAADLVLALPALA
jgi:polyene glycosyltransferase